MCPGALMSATPFSIQLIVWLSALASTVEGVERWKTSLTLGLVQSDALAINPGLPTEIGFRFLGNY